MKKKLSLLLAFVMMTSMLATGCGTKDTGSSNDMGASKEDDTFKVGMEAAYAPFNWTQIGDSNGGVPIQGTKEYAGGYDVEIAKKIADKLGKKVVVVKTQWEGLLPAVQSGKIDAIIAGMSPTAERKQSIDFSDIYYTSNLVMVVKKGSTFEKATSIQDFKGAKITAQLGTFHYTVIGQINGVSKQTAMKDFSAMRVALESGKIDGYVSEYPEGVSASTANKNFAMVQFAEGKGFTTSPDDTAIAVGVKKNSELTSKINEVLAGISEEERKEIMDAAIQHQPSQQ